MWNFRRPGGSGTEQPSSDAMPARDVLPVSHSPLFLWRATPFPFLAEKRKWGCIRGPMSTREGQAASVTLLRREQLRSASAPTNMSEVRQKIEEAGGQGRPPLQEVRRKPEERAGRLSLQHKNAAIQHRWLRFDLGCYSPFSLSKKPLRLGCEASPVASSSLRSSSFCSLVSFVGVSTTTVTN